MILRALMAMTIVGALAACGSVPMPFSSKQEPLPEREVDLISLNREAQLASESGETAKAEALYKSLVRRMPNDADTWLRLGNLYARNNKPDEAVGAYHRALIINSKEPRAWYNLSVIRMRQAWAAMLQVPAQEALASGDPLRKQAEDMLAHMEKLPFLQDEQRKPLKDADATRY